MFFGGFCGIMFITIYAPIVRGGGGDVAGGVVCSSKFGYIFISKKIRKFLFIKSEKCGKI